MRNIKWWKEEQKNKKGGKKSTKIKEGEIIEFEFSWFFWN